MEGGVVVWAEAREANAMDDKVIKADEWENGGEIFD